MPKSHIAAFEPRFRGFEPKKVGNRQLTLTSRRFRDLQAGQNTRLPMSPLLPGGNCHDISGMWAQRHGLGGKQSGQSLLAALTMRCDHPVWHLHRQGPVGAEIIAPFRFGTLPGRYGAAAAPMPPGFPLVPVAGNWAKSWPASLNRIKIAGLLDIRDVFGGLGVMRTRGSNLERSSYPTSIMEAPAPRLARRRSHRLPLFALQSGRTQPRPFKGTLHPNRDTQEVGRDRGGPLA